MKRISVCTMHRRRQRGIGIIEVLVALVVVSFGVLGVAGMQLTGIKHSADGFNRSKALMLAENLATRMRINEAGVLNQSYAGFNSGTDVSCAAPPAPYCQAYSGKPAQACSVEELAVFDLYSVSCGDLGTAGSNAGVNGLLPAGATLAVQCDSSPCIATSTYSITVSWPDSVNASSNEDDTVKRVQMRLRP